MGNCMSMSGDYQMWGYLDDGKGWTARPKSEYMTSPDYNKELRHQLRAERKTAAAERLHNKHLYQNMGRQKMHHQNMHHQGMPPQNMYQQPPWH